MKIWAVLLQSDTRCEMLGAGKTRAAASKIVRNHVEQLLLDLAEDGQMETGDFKEVLKSKRVDFDRWQSMTGIMYTIDQVELQ